MSKHFSLEHTLTFRLALILAGSFLLFTLVYLFQVENDAIYHASEQAGELARDLGSTIHPDASGRPAFDRAKVEDMESWPQGTGFAAIVLPSGETVSGSAPDLLLGLRDHSASQMSGNRLLNAPGGNYNVLANERVLQDGVTYRIAVLRQLTPGGIIVSGLEHEFTEELLPGFLPAVLAAVLVTWLTIRRNLRPLRLASAEASAVSAEKLGQRMTTTGLSDEIQPLIEAMNRALSLLEGALLAQQRFTANAAHELRTPLAVLLARVDGLERGPVRTALTQDIGRMSRAVSQMLLTARLQARAQGETAPVDLAFLARDVVAELAPLAHAQGRDIVLDVLSRPTVLGSAAALNSATRNLAENALRFTPKGSAVHVQVGPGAQIVVEDHGPGIPDHDKARVFEPFWRANGQRGGGAGLGLAIVNEVATLHGGQVRVEDADGGGARFILVLDSVPRKDAAAAQIAPVGIAAAKKRSELQPSGVSVEG